MYLNSRQARIVAWLLQQTEPRSSEEAGEALQLSARVLRYNLPAVEGFLEDHGLTLRRRRGAGIWIDGDDEERHRLKVQLGQGSESHRVFGPAERKYLTVRRLLSAAPSEVRIQDLEEALEVSRASARRDLVVAESWLVEHGLPISRRPGRGIQVVGDEVAIRRALVKLILDAVPSEVLLERMQEPSDAALVRVNRGLRDYLAALDLDRCWRIVAHDDYLQGAISERALLSVTLHIAVVSSRVAAGRTVTMEPGQLRSLSDHPVSSAARRVAAHIEDLTGTAMPETEIAAITQYLLGMIELRDVAAGPKEADIDRWVDEILEVSASELHGALGDDSFLAGSLHAHLQRLQVRLRYGLPIHNPLLEDVAARYPDVFAAAAKAVKKLEDLMTTQLPDDEIGFLTMYLGGALERMGLSPPQRAIVVCPSGVATVWLLVSRLQAEFPQLELVNVVSRNEFEEARDTDHDLVISTVDLPEYPGRTVVVHPLLPSEDVRHLAAALESPSDE